MKLLGIDVGFAVDRDTTGVAFYSDGDCGAWRATTDWADRTKNLPPNFKADICAVDAPILGPLNTDPLIRRECELYFSKYPFQHRCKPGLSHCGTGLELRKAGEFTRQQVLTGGMADVVFEAFPNTFIGVLVPNQQFLEMPELKRGKKFDWLYDTAVKYNSFGPLFDLLDVPAVVRYRVESESDHEMRAAWICLLTAWCVYKNQVHAVGDEEGGWFWLPPQDLWQPWTLDENHQLSIF